MELIVAVRRKFDDAMVEVDIEAAMDRSLVPPEDRRELMKIHRGTDREALATIIGAIVDAATQVDIRRDRTEWTLAEERRYNDLIFDLYVGQLRIVLGLARRLAGDPSG